MAVRQNVYILYVHFSVPVIFSFRGEKLYYYWEVRYNSSTSYYFLLVNGSPANTYIRILQIEYENTILSLKFVLSAEIQTHNREFSWVLALYAFKD